MGPTDMDACPCNSGKDYSQCCQPYLDGATTPLTAEALMRSRYTAYARRRIEYLGETHDPRTRRTFDPARAREWAEGSEWLGLEVLATEGGNAGDNDGTVEFIARYQARSEEIEHHEVAQFRRADDRWYFVDGRVIGPEPFRRDAPKVGRNDPCPCGSGKKHKKCCGKP
jgi:SEC-C motif-containing protein